MKKKFSTALITIALSALLAVPSFADATRVVTLGNDLSIQQKAQMLQYFGVDENSVEIIYVNNDQERYYLGSYIPLEQIGDRTFSCSYVKPTTSGGIQVKTANLDYVTCNMIATTLSTCGVTNCQVVAASPIVVSGTGALTGIIIAYQQASGETLDETKVELANREMVVTAGLSEQVGQSNAIAIVNETKYETIENNITNIKEIHNVVNNISNEYNIEIEDSQKEEIANLVAEIAQQNYEIESLKKTLAEVQANVIEDTDAPEAVQQDVIQRNDEIIQEEEKKAEETTTVEKADIDIDVNTDTNIDIPEETEENILDNTDSSALSGDGAPVQESDTLSPVVEQETTTEAEENLYSEEDFADMPEIADKYELYTQLKEKLNDYTTDFSEDETDDTIKEMIEEILEKFVDHSVKEAKGEIEEETSSKAEEILVPETDVESTAEEAAVNEKTKDIVIRKEYEKINCINNDILAALEKNVYEELEANKDVLSNLVTITISENGEVTDTLQKIYDDIMGIAEEVYTTVEVSIE